MLIISLGSTSTVSQHIFDLRLTSNPSVEKQKDKKLVDSPFVSTSSNLLWIISEKLLKGLKAGEKTGRISVIDTNVLDKRGVFYAKTVRFLSSVYRVARS